MTKIGVFVMYYKNRAQKMFSTNVLPVKKFREDRYRLRANKLLQYDAANRKITNSADADKYLKRDYRQGWDPSTI